MRGLPLLFVLFLAGAAHAASPRLPLDLPVRYPGAAAAGAVPAYAGEVVEVALTPAAARLARRAGAGPGRLERLGVADLDRAAADLGGARFERMFPGERPPAAGSAARDFTAFYRVHLPPGVALEAALERLGAAPSVACASPIAILRTGAVPDDSLFAGSYWFAKIEAEQAWDLTTGDTSVVVAILDTGILLAHPDLGGTTPGSWGQIWTNWVEAGGQPGVDDDGNGLVDDLHGWDFVSLSGPGYAGSGEDWADPDNDPNDFAAHGTAVAGVVGAIANNRSGEPGTVWNTRLMPVRVGWWPFGEPVGVGAVRMDFVACAILYATRNGARVINCSFESDNGELDPVTCSALDAALAEAHAAGVTIVTAAGNNGGPITPARAYLSTRPEVISVGSTNPFDSFSSWSDRGPEVDVSAPGEALSSTWLTHGGSGAVPAYRANLSGTSLSAPLVSGAAALIQARQKQLGRDPLPPEGVLLRLWETADDIAAQNPGLQGQYGGGRLNLRRAVNDPLGSSVTRLGDRVNGAPVVLLTNEPPQRANRAHSWIAFATRDQRLLVLDGTTRDTVALAPLPSAATGGVASGWLGSANGTGVFVGCDGRVAGFRPNGTPLPGWPVAGQPGVAHLLPAVADLEGDGTAEIVCGAEDGSVRAWRASGAPLWSLQVANGAVRVAVARLTGSAESQVVTVGEDGVVTVVGPDGTTLPGTWPVTLAGPPSAPVVTLWGGIPTILIAAGSQLHALAADGAARPGFPVTLSGFAVPGEEPALGDVDGDGHVDVVVATVGPATLDVRDSTGVSRAGWPRALAQSPLGSPVLGNVSGPGGTDLLIFLGSGLAGFAGDATPLAAFPRPGGAGHRPFLADLDARLDTDVVAGSGPVEPLLYVYGTGSPFDPATAPWPTHRGNTARTGSFPSPAPPPIDVIRPGRIGDLAAVLRGSDTVVLQWTAPGNDEDLGRAAFYDLRRAGSPLHSGNFEGATRVSTGSPAAAGEADSVRVTGLIEGQTYYFAIRAGDADGNVSEVSNGVAITIPAVSPAAVGDLRATVVTDTSVTLRWTATGADGTSGRPRLYVVRAATEPMDDAVFGGAPYQRVVNATVDAGGIETVQFRFLERGTRYWFGLKAYDEAGNGSPLSNVIVVQTGLGGPLAGKLGIAVAPGSNPSRTPARIYWQADPAALGQRQWMAFHDLFGRRVRSIELGTGAAGIAAWDGLDERGHRLPAGVYVVRFASGPYHRQARIVLLP